MKRRARLVVLQGPTQGLTACAALDLRDDNEPLPSFVVVGGLATSHADALTTATIDCCASRSWEGVLGSVDVESPKHLRARLAGWEIVELLIVRNWQDINTVPMAAFPDARRVMYGDAFGCMNPLVGPGHPVLDEAMAVLPFEETPRALEGVALTVVDRATMLSVIERTRAAVPELVEQDAKLGEFARGGTLLLGSYLTEVRSATLSGEIRHLRRLFEATQTPPGAPVLIKPHPRASLGQVGAIARMLRARGHPVRVLGRATGGLYPIEIFSAVAAAVRIAEGGASASIVALRHLHGVDARATDDYASHPFGFSVSARRRLSAVTQAYNKQLAALPAWDGASPLPKVGPESPRRDDSVRQQLWRLVAWRPTKIGTAKRRRMDEDVSDPGSSFPARWVDDENGLTWCLQHSQLRALRNVEMISDPREALRRALGSLHSAQCHGRFVLVAAVTPSSHLPALESMTRSHLSTVVDPRAVMPAEEVEELLEVVADVLERRSVAPHSLPTRFIRLQSVMTFVASMRTEPHAAGPST